MNLPFLCTFVFELLILFDALLQKLWIIQNLHMSPIPVDNLAKPETTQLCSRKLIQGTKLEIRQKCTFSPAALLTAALHECLETTS